MAGRRTQEERSAETQQRLLEATVACLVESGYSGTTTSAVQERAGVSRGALMHHFSTKNELLVGSVAHLAARRAENLRSEAARLPEGSDRLSAAIDLLWEVFSGPLFTAILELWTASRTDESLREAVRSHERGLRGDLETVLRELFGDEIASAPAFASAIELTLHVMRGAALTSILRTDLDRRQAVIEDWKRTFSVLIGNTMSEVGP